MASGAETGEKKDYIMEHILDGPDLHSPFGHIHLPHLELFGFDISITRHVFFMWLAALILIISFFVSTRRRGIVPSGFANAIEALVVFIRDEVAKPNIGEKDHRRYMPYLLTVFFFILTCNFLGLVPWGSTATANVSVTAGLALCTFLMTQIAGMIHNGVFSYWKNLVPHGLPLPVTLILIPIEIIGLFSKPFALCIRLFANMTAGHVIILAILGLIFTFKAYAVAAVAVPFTLAIYLLECFVALVQAYVFTTLSAVFIGMAVHQEH
ncbi:TPA: ATP synthase F0 subunit A [Candidatus Latescibacteria bacterium]|nr:ATP synthase F0 subunit A [Gemmatimonadota bacterium]HAA73952.1 ATP synthase F0 subunit A [Candidatus Latescibacterota bacterium]|tara:strand:- start:1322 stop:2122 length:801 start_codon:yes stop_codon:yes gene_type:complete